MLRQNVSTVRSVPVGTVNANSNGAIGKWLGNSVWHAPDLQISKIRTGPTISAMSFTRGEGEGTWRNERHRLVFAPDPFLWANGQVEQGPTQERRLIAPGSVSFYPANLTVRIIHPAARFVQVVWDADLFSKLLPELGGAPSRFEFLGAMHDALLGPIVTSLAQEIDGGFADKILIESLGTALCIRIARHFIGRLPLPASPGLSMERLQRVRDYVEAHLDEDLSLTMLAGITGLTPYHFSRSFKQAVGVGPQRYVIQRRLERAKALLRHTRQPLALIAQDAGFTDQSHLTTIFRRETGVTPSRFRGESI